MLPNGTPDNERMHSSQSHIEKSNIEQFFYNSKKPNLYLTSPSSSTGNMTSYIEVKKNKTIATTRINLRIIRYKELEIRNTDCPHLFI